jgi:hypothetical protein
MMMSADSNNNTQTKLGAPIDPASMVAAFWSQWLEQSTRGTQALLEIAQGASDPQHVKERQQQWLETAAESCDDFLRSTPFMEMMRQHLKSVIDLKTMQDQFIKGAARHFGMPLADDVFGLFERLHSTEQTILHRLQAIEERLQAIEELCRPEASGPKKRAAHD